MTHRQARRVIVACVLVASLWVGACAKPKPGEFVPFTENLRIRYEITQAELRALQFYISHQIVLERVAQGGEARVERGRLIARGETFLHQVVVRAGTRGSIEEGASIGLPEEGFTLDVSFEPGAPLRFAPWEPGGAYTLESPPRVPTLAELWTGITTTRRRRFEVPFAGEDWWVEAGAAAALLIETDALERLVKTRRVLKGVRAPDAR